MESSAQNVIPEDADQPSEHVSAASSSFERDPDADLYAQAELERRHERIEMMIAKAMAAAE